MRAPGGDDEHVVLADEVGEERVRAGGVAHALAGHAVQDPHRRLLSSGRPAARAAGRADSTRPALLSLAALTSTR